MTTILKPPHAKGPGTVAYLAAGFLSVQYSGAAAVIVIQAQRHTGTGRPPNK